MKYFLTVLGFFFLVSITSAAYADSKVCFSPNGGCQEIVITELTKAQKSIDIAMYAINSREIAQAVVKAKERGVKIKIILDKSQIKDHFSKAKYFTSKGIDVKFRLGPGLMHDSFAVIDDQVLLTGSFNWTVPADKKNAENLLVIMDSELIQKYNKQFRHLWGQSGQLAFDLLLHHTSTDAVALNVNHRAYSV